ncbi:monoheme cytochrome C [Maribacter sp. PR1]|uniref:Monoheme cytochrome C n=1 Tax=Maribacter cobaltidurans TaxID=1178778 RepID=A0ABU7ISR3_9FLAO|nr:MULTISPECIES: monoheme cytochrome C [Maribacter]MDC6388622.1 monoheme cytochrome C [Maribacter sp. PR1]MEE1976011.1 monoheme cytochrome C [Maribacter cobaltidurans]
MIRKPIHTYLAIAALVLISLGVIFLIIRDSGVETDDTMELIDNGVDDQNPIVDGIHVSTGLVEGEGLEEVVTNCTTCHSSKLIIQNRMGKEQWNATIRWMQETQGLWDLGEDQDIIVDYLTTNYPVFKKGRRAVLGDIEWYTLEGK